MGWDQNPQLGDKKLKNLPWLGWDMVALKNHQK
jgi:hypothetical protein